MYLLYLFGLQRLKHCRMHIDELLGLTLETLIVILEFLTNKLFRVIENPQSSWKLMFWGLQRHSSSLISDNDHAYVALHLYSTTIVKLTFFQDLLGGPSIIDFTSTACTFPFSLAHKGNQFQVLILNQSCSWSCILTSAQNRYST